MDLGDLGNKLINEMSKTMENTVMRRHLSQT